MTIANHSVADAPAAASRLLTAEEFAALPGDARSELIRGEIVEMPTPGARHGKLTGRMSFILQQHITPRGLGDVLTNDSGFILERGPDTVRGPDVSFIRADRVPADGLPDGHFPGPPDLAIEVLSPSDVASDVEDKIALYLDAGCPLVVVLNPKRRTATLHRPGNVDPHVVRGDEPLDLSPVVEGFRCALDDVFG